MSVNGQPLKNPPKTRPRKVGAHTTAHIRTYLSFGGPCRFISCINMLVWCVVANKDHLRLPPLLKATLRIGGVHAKVGYICSCVMCFCYNVLFYHSHFIPLTSLLYFLNLTVFLFFCALKNYELKRNRNIYKIFSAPLILVW